MYNCRKKLFVNLKRRPSANARENDRLVVDNRGNVCEAVFLLQLLGLVVQNAKAFANVIGDFLSCDADHRRVPDRTFFEHGKVRCPSTNIEKRDPHLLLFIIKHGIARCERLQNHVGNFKTCALDTLVDVLCGADKAGDDMNVGLHAHTGHTEWVIDAILSIDDELLRDDVNDLSVGRKCDTLRILDEAVDIGLRHFMVRPADANHAAALEALNMVAGNADHHRLDIHTRLRARLIHCGTDRPDRSVDVCHYPAHHPF